MKKRITFILCLALAVGIFIFNTSTSVAPSSSYTPVFMERSELNKSVSYQAGEREMKSTGKIYFKTPYIYVNERYKGVHVINNADPKNPIKEGFIVAPGCIDMAVKGDIMYIDNAVDLVAFDLVNRKVTKRIENVFPEPSSPDNMRYYAGSARPDGFILVGWKK